LVLLALNMCYFSVQDPRIPHICSLVFLDFSLYVIYPWVFLDFSVWVGANFSFE
jgi:hypothetical protein